VRAIKEAGSMNPVVLLDEIDKVGSDFRGDPAAALLEVLDPAQNHTFRDHYLEVELDLSDVVFLATANVLEAIPEALADRMEIVRLDGYTEDEKVVIARDHLLPRQLERAGLAEDEVTIDEGALRKLAGEYTREAGVRNLERSVARLLRKVAARHELGERELPYTVTDGDLRELIGRPHHVPESAQDPAERRTSVPGVATGLAVTGAGGDVLYVEASLADPETGAAGLTLTGQLGDVMKESAQIALSFLRSRGAVLALVGPPADHAKTPVGTPLAHREVLGDPLLHVLKARVLGVEDGLGALDVVRVLGTLAPRHLQDRVEPGADPRALGRLVGGPLQLVDLLERGLADVLGQVGGLHAGAVVVGLLAVLLAVQLAQLLADRFQLTPQQELALLLVDAFLDVLGDGLGDVLLGEVVAQLLGGELQPGHRVGGLQQLDLLVGGQEGRVSGVVGEGRDVVDGLDPVDDLPGAALAQPGGGEGLVFLDQFGDLAGQRLRHGLVEAGALDPEGGAGTRGPRTDAHAPPAADQCARVAVGEPADLLDGAEDTGVRVGPVDPWHQEYPGLPGR
jgi:hypothetical protein